MLVIEAATGLTARGRSPFKLSDLIAVVQGMHSTRERGTIQPVVQGMTANAGKGTASPCGKVLFRVDRGFYELREGAGADLATADARPDVRRAAPRARRSRSLGQAELEARVAALIADFDVCVDVYDSSTPFTRVGQYDLHRQTVDRRRELGSAEAAATDERFVELLHSTLRSWGIGRRASRLAALGASARDSTSARRDSVNSSRCRSRWPLSTSTERRESWIG